MKVRCRTLRSLFSSLVVVGLVSGCSSAPVDSAPVDPRFAAETYDEYTEPLTNAVIGTPEGITVIRPVGEQTGTAASALGADGGPTGGTGGSSGAGSGMTVTGVGGSTVSGAGGSIGKGGVGGSFGVDGGMGGVSGEGGTGSEGSPGF